MPKHFHEKFIARIKYLLEVEKHSMENISKKTGIPLDDLIKYHEEDDIANKFEYQKLSEAFKSGSEEEKSKSDTEDDKPES